MPGLKVELSGVTFDTFQAALAHLYFMPKTQEEFDEARKFVLPMQHNIENPIQPGTQDTYIQYWIDRKDRLTQDIKFDNLESSQMVADITVRFLGVRAEAWAAMLHHLTKQRFFSDIMLTYCHARALEYIGPIVPTNVDYFGTGSTTKAYTVAMSLVYDEVIDYSEGSAGSGILQYISFPAGTVEE